MIATTWKFHQTGDTGVLREERCEVPAPGPGEARVRHTAIGLNFIDIYHRTGLYPLPLPSGIGIEAAGIVEETGPGTQLVSVGDRVAYAMGPPGACATMRVIPARHLVRLPEGISNGQAASMMLKGMTAEYLLFRTFPVRAGQTVLVYAAVGGVGQILCQWAQKLGATVIGVVGSAEKAALARTKGCAHVINRKTEDIAGRVRDITGGKGVPVVYDSVGKSSFEASLDSLSPRGLLVSFGNASGQVPPLDPGLLGRKGSLFLTRPSLAHYIATREELELSSGRLFEAVLSGSVVTQAANSRPLAELRHAQEELELGRTTGATVLVP